MTELTLRRVDPAATVATVAVPRLQPANDVGGSEAERIRDSDVELALVTTLDEFHRLEDEWNALFEAAGEPAQLFQSYAWCWHWCRHYLSGGRGGPRLAIVTGRLAGRLVLLMPLVVERRAGLRQLAWLGDPVSQYGDIVAAEPARAPAVLARAWRLAVTATGADVASLRKVRADSFAARMLRDARAEVVAAEEAPWIDLAPFAAYPAFDEALPGKGRRKNRRRQMRRLEERGPVEIEVHESSEDAARLADYAIRLKRAWLKSRDLISPALADDRFAAFFADVAHGRGKPVGVKVMALRTHGEVAALDIFLDCKGTRFLHVAVFALKFEKSGAGALLLEGAIKRCFDDRLTAFDMLAPKHDYKLDFTERVVAIEDWALALTARGRVWTSGYLAFRRRIKRAVEGLPAPLRRTAAAVLALTRRGKPGQ